MMDAFVMRNLFFFSFIASLSEEVITVKRSEQFFFFLCTA
jgi:hypothetical protein